MQFNACIVMFKTPNSLSPEYLSSHIHKIVSLPDIQGELVFFKSSS